MATGAKAGIAQQGSGMTAHRDVVTGPGTIVFKKVRSALIS